MERRLKDLKNGMEQVKQKEKYQLRQIAAVRTGTRKKAEMSEEMGENQLVSIKEVLENDSKEIADMVKKINLAKRDVTV